MSEYRDVQHLRHTGSVAAPSTLKLAQLAYNDPGNGSDVLYIGSNVPADGTVKTLISASRQVEINGAQTILGAKTIGVNLLKIPGGTSGQVLSTDGAGNLSWATGTGGGGGSGTVQSVTAGAGLQGGTITVSGTI